MHLYDLLSTSWGPRKAGSVFPTQVQSQRTKSTEGGRPNISAQQSGRES